jgi:hypothetical protein
MTRIRVVYGMIALAIAAGIVTAIAAQPPSIAVRKNVANNSYNIRVVNGLNLTVYYKLVAGKDKSYVHATLKPGQSEPDRVTGGQKTLCVWDMNDQLILACGVYVDGSGDIVIGDTPKDDWNTIVPPEEVLMNPPPEEVSEKPRDPNNGKVAYAPASAYPRRLKIRSNR